MPLAIKSPASLPFVSALRIFSAAAIAASAAALPASAGGRRLRAGGSVCGLRFGLCDLGFGHLCSPRDKVLDPDLGLGGHALGFGFRAGDDGLCLAFGGLALALIFGQQRRRFVLELS